jgi:hypothetical protein
LKAEADAETARQAQERVTASLKIQQETNLRNKKATELKGSTLAKARADAADAAAERKQRVWSAATSPAAATAGTTVSDARAEASAMLKSGVLDGSSPSALAAKQKFATLLAKISS